MAIDVKNVAMGVEFAALALGRAKELKDEPSAHAPEDWAWAQASAQNILPALLSGDGSDRWPTEPTMRQLAALAGYVSHACREISASLAEVAVLPVDGEPAGATVKCGPHEVLMVRSAAGLTLRSQSLDGRGAPSSENYQGSFDLAFRVTREDLISEAGRRAISLFWAPSGTHLRRAVIGGAEGREIDGYVSAVLRVVVERLDLWSDNLPTQAGVMAAERAARILYGKPLVGKDAARMLIGAAQQRGSDPISKIFNLRATAWDIEAAEQAPEAAVFVSAVARTLFGENGSRELGRDRISLVKKELRKNYDLTDGGWKALLRHCNESSFFSAALGAELELLSQNNPARAAIASSFNRAGFAKPFPDGGARSEEASELRGVCVLASLCAERGIELGDGLAFASSCYWAGGVETASAGRPGSLLSLISMAPIIWREWSDHDQNIEMEARADMKSRLLERRSSWLKLLARYEISDKALLDPEAFVELRAAGWKPEGEEELTFAALERDRAARESKSPALIGAMIQRGLEAGWSKEALEYEEVDVMDFLREVELGFWDEAPKKITWPWIQARSQEWHDAVSEKSASTATWAQLQQEFFDCGPGWVARELTSGGELFQEGKEMRHCVSSYANRCAQGDCRIFSLRSLDGALKSTIELSCEYGDASRRGKDGALVAPLSVNVVQHRAFANSSPSVMAKIAAGRLAEAINDACASLSANPGLAAPLQG